MIHTFFLLQECSGTIKSSSILHFTCIQHSIPSHLVQAVKFSLETARMYAVGVVWAKEKNKTPARLTDSGIIVCVIRPLGDFFKKDTNG